jgi:4-hydroxybenzoate polyprenyltransferase
LKRKLNGLIRLLRFKEYFFFVIVTTLLGATASNGVFGWRLLGALVGNWLAVAFSFMVNDVEDADDDALNPAKVQRNPVSAKDITRRAAWSASWIVGVLSAILYFSLGWLPFLFGMICLLLGFFYSWRRVRFKNLAIIDMVSHCMMLSGLQFLTGYFTFDHAHTPFDRWFFPFLFVTCVSLYGELFNEIRDLDGDLLAGLKHTAAVLGPKPTYVIMWTVMLVGIGSAVYTVIWIKLIAAWVCWLTLALAVVFMAVPLIKGWREKNYVKLQESLQKPLEIAAALALLVQFVAPWALSMLRM